MPSETFSSNLNVFILLFFSLTLVIKFRENLPMLLTMIFLFYLIYSISVGEYITGGRLGAPFTQQKTPIIYGTLLKIMICFISGLSLFLDKRINKVNFPAVKNNVYIFYTLMLILVLIGIFGVNRTIENSYTVQISAYYEYSVILFCFAYYTSGNLNLRKAIWIVLILLFIFQDYYYGGRITSLQLILLLCFTMLKKILNKKIIVILVFFGIFINQAIGIYRNNYSLSSTIFLNIFKDIKSDLFVFDTPVYAYYSSATHIAAVQKGYVTSNLRVESFLNFLKSIFLGGSNDSGNVTRYISEHITYNIGGGLFPTHFYFWFGMSGVLIAVVILVTIFNKLSRRKDDLSKILIIICFLSIPRWFLYNPLILFRMILLTICIFYVYKFANAITKNNQN